MGRSLAQSARDDWGMPHGLPWFSRDMYAFPSSAGKSDSMRVL